MNPSTLPGRRSRLPILPTPGQPGRFHRLRFIEAGGDPQGTPAPVPAPPAPTPAPPAPAPAAPEPPKPQNGTFSQEYVTELREEAKAHRLKADTAETTNATLTSDLEKARQELAELKQSGALDKAIKAADGNSIAAMAIKGASALDGIDLGDEAAVNKAVKEFIDAHPELKAAPQATRSGVTHAGGSGEGSARPTSIAEALTRANGA